MAKAMSGDERFEVRRLIDARCDRKIDELSVADPEWENRVAQRKRKVAIGKLKVEKDVAALEQVERDIARLEGIKSEIEERISKKMPREPEHHGRNSGSGCSVPKSLCAAIRDVEKTVHLKVMRDDATGRKALKIEADRNRRMELLAGCTTRDQVNELKVLC